MGRNEIRIRRNSMSSGRIAQHRNYGDLMARHERDQKLRRISRIFIYFLIILFMILVFLFVRKWEENQREKIKKNPESTAYIASQPASQSAS